MTLKPWSVIILFRTPGLVLNTLGANFASLTLLWGGGACRTALKMGYLSICWSHDSDHSPNLQSTKSEVCNCKVDMHK